MANEKIRVSQHNERGVKSSEHNDRKFDVNKAEHIDGNKVHLNIYKSWIDYLDPNERANMLESYPQLKDMSFSELEVEFYNYQYSDMITKTNENYLKNYHPERCKSAVDYLNSKKLGAEEILLQIGDLHADIPNDVFIDCANEYLDALTEWATENGDHMHILDVAMHFDESSPHMHIRRCWDYVDETGIICLGQEKALEQSNMSLPKPDQKHSRTNNRKMEFDKMMREKWISIVESRGFDVEKIPLPKRKHVDKPEYVRQQKKEFLSREKALKSDLKAYQSNVMALMDEKESFAKEKELFFDTQNAFKRDLSDFEVEKAKFHFEMAETQNKTQGMALEAKQLLCDARKQRQEILSFVHSIANKLPADVKRSIGPDFNKLRDDGRAKINELLQKADDLSSKTPNNGLDFNK